MYRLGVIAMVVLASCTAARLPVGQQFVAESDGYKVKGLQGWQVNQHLQFGEYSTGVVKRGWDFSSGFQHPDFIMTPEQAVMQVFHIQANRVDNYSKNSYRYSISSPEGRAEVFALEKFNEELLVFKSNNPFIGNASATKSYEYAFSSAIVLGKSAKPWSLVLINRQDLTGTRPVRDMVVKEEEGYVTDGQTTYAIRPVRMNEGAANATIEKKSLGNLFAGYEIQRDGKVVAVIDILDNQVRLRKDLAAADRLLLAAVTTSIMLKRMHDVDNDNDAPNP